MMNLAVVSSGENYLWGFALCVLVTAVLALLRGLYLVIRSGRKGMVERARGITIGLSGCGEGRVVFEEPCRKQESTPSQARSFQSSSKRKTRGHPPASRGQ